MVAALDKETYRPLDGTERLLDSLTSKGLTSEAEMVRGLADTIAHILEEQMRIVTKNMQQQTRIDIMTKTCDAISKEGEKNRLKSETYENLFRGLFRTNYIIFDEHLTYEDGEWVLNHPEYGGDA